VGFPANSFKDLCSKDRFAGAGEPVLTRAFSSSSLGRFDMYIAERLG